MDWKRANRPPFKSRVHQLKCWENCALAVQICKDALHLPIVSINHVDIARGTEKAILSLLWQLMRYHTLQILGSLQSGLEADASAAAAAAGRQPTAAVQLADDDILRWANAKLQSSTFPAWDSMQRQAEALDGGKAPQSPCIGSFRDPVISRGVVLLRLLAAIAPDAVDPKHISPGLTLPEQASNCKYVISVARKLGCAIFLSWEDIVHVRSRMMVILLASLMLLDRRLTADRAADIS